MSCTKWISIGVCVVLQRVCSDLANGRNVDLRQLDAHCVQLYLVYRELVAAELLGEQVALALDCVRQALQIIETALENEDGCNNHSVYQAQALSAGSIGRPSFDIPFNQLSNLLELRFTVPQIADILGVSVRTVRRRMTTYNLSVRSYYSQICDSDLDATVSEISILWQ